MHDVRETNWEQERFQPEQEEIEAAFRALRDEQASPSSQKSWERALEYHRERPAIFAAFCRFTGQIINAGFEHFGSMDVIGRVRWYTRVEKKGEYKIRNVMHPYYARVFMKIYPEYSGLFRITSKELVGMRHVLP